MTSNEIGQVLFKHKEVADYLQTTLGGFNTGLSEEQFYAMNIVDATDVSIADMQAVKDKFIQYCTDNGCYAALPPFEEGSFIDKAERRYFHWKVLDVHEDYYRLEVEYYPLFLLSSSGLHTQGDFSNFSHSCWYLAGRTTIKVKFLDAAEYLDLLSYNPDYSPSTKSLTSDWVSDFLNTSHYIGGVVEAYEYYYTHDLEKIRKKGKYYTSDGEFINGAWVKEVVDTTLDQAADRGRKCMLFVCCSALIEMFIYINYMLSQKSTSSSTLRHITSIYVPSTDTSELRKERHFGKIKLISEKKPRAVNATNVQRIYTTLSWQRRSHIRHLASGKIVPVKSAICKRRNAEDASAPQVIYKV